MATAVVCDDDRVLRKAISGLCEQAGLEVVAETDSGSDLLELVRRFAIDVVVLDLSLSEGSGEIALKAMVQMTPPPTVVIFSAYADEADRLLDIGAHAVIEKPALVRLGEVIDRLGQPDHDGGGARSRERRASKRHVAPAPEIWRSPSGVSSVADLPATLQATAAGDALLLVNVGGLTAIEAAAGPALAADCALAVGRRLRETLRVQDVVHESPERHGFVAVLRGGDQRASMATWDRLCGLVADDDLPGRLTGSCTRIGGDGGEEALARLLRATPSPDLVFVTS